MTFPIITLVLTCCLFTSCRSVAHRASLTDNKSTSGKVPLSIQDQVQVARAILNSSEFKMIGVMRSGAVERSQPNQGEVITLSPQGAGRLEIQWNGNFPRRSGSLVVNANNYQVEIQVLTLLAVAHFANDEVAYLTVQDRDAPRTVVMTKDGRDIPGVTGRLMAESATLENLQRYFEDAKTPVDQLKDVKSKQDFSTASIITYQDGTRANVLAEPLYGRILDVIYPDGSSIELKEDRKTIVRRKKGE